VNILKIISGYRKRRHYYLLKRLFKKYQKFTMIPKEVFLNNLLLVEKFRTLSGCVIECGVWRGGMIASISEVLGNDRRYYLFDSFEGLPQAKEVDGIEANKWQADKNSSSYFDNCKAEMWYAESAMKLAGQNNYSIIKGWFSETLPGFKTESPIAILRLDGDWYDSTIECLNILFPLVEKGGVVIIDDYYAWDGCSRAVHDYLSKNNLEHKIRSFNNISYIIK
jgi:O-methyltransferase